MENKDYNKTSNMSRHIALYNTRVVMDCITLAIGLPVVLLAIYVLYHQAKSKQAVHVFVINLLVSDLFQFSGRVIQYIRALHISFFTWISFWFGITASVVFMVSIAVERYLLIAHPHWYRFHSSRKCSIITSLVLWVLLLLIFACFWACADYKIHLKILPAILLLPFPLLTLLYLGTWRCLSKSTVSPEEKRRIMIVLGLVIGNYTLLFLPTILIFSFIDFKYQFKDIIHLLGIILLFFSPFVDSLMYIFLKKSSINFLEDFFCCRKAPLYENTNTTIAMSDNVTS